MDAPSMVDVNHADKQQRCLGESFNLCQYCIVLEEFIEENWNLYLFMFACSTKITSVALQRACIALKHVSPD